jgi:hypothetical protein
MITYRPLAAGDREVCVRVHHLSMRAYVDPLWGWNEAQQATMALEFLEHRSANHEMALLSEAPIGYLSYQNKGRCIVPEQTASTS